MNPEAELNSAVTISHHHSNLRKHSASLSASLSFFRDVRPPLVESIISLLFSLLPKTSASQLRSNASNDLATPSFINAHLWHYFFSGFFSVLPLATLRKVKAVLFMNQSVSLRWWTSIRRAWFSAKWHRLVGIRWVNVALRDHSYNGRMFKEGGGWWVNL